MSSMRGPDADSVFKTTKAVYWAFQLAPIIYIALIAVFAASDRRPWLDERTALGYLASAGFALASIVQLWARERFARRSRRLARARGDGFGEAMAAAELSRMSINEAVAMYGLAVFLLTGSIWLAVPFLLLGIGALYVSRPTRDRWRETAKEDRA